MKQVLVLLALIVVWTASATGGETSVPPAAH
jgi:hypothetical protein